MSGAQQVQGEQASKGPGVARDGRDTRPLVAHLIYRLDHGGLEQLLVELLRRMPSTAFRHTVVCIADYAEGFRQRLPREVEVYALHKPPGLGLGTLLRSFFLLRRLRPDVTHSCNLAALEHQPMAALSGVPARIHVEHGWDVSDLYGTKRKYRLIRRCLSPWVHRHVTVSHHLASYLTERVGIPSSRVQHIYNGVAVERFDACLGKYSAEASGKGSAEGSDKRFGKGPDNGFCDGGNGAYAPRSKEHSAGSVDDEPDGSPDGPFVIGTIGRLTAVKDQASLIRAFAQLRHYVSEGRFAQLRLIVIGSGPLAAELHETAESLGIGEQIWLAGVREDIETQLGRFDLFVLPSLAEGVPVTVLEAMACARPVVASAVGGVPELVVDGSTGTLVPAADPQSLARALAGYVDDPQLCRRHGEAGRERVLEHFSLERMVDDYQNLYLELLSNARTPPRARSVECEYACRAEETRHSPRVSGREG